VRRDAALTAIVEAGNSRIVALAIDAILQVMAG
jgi:hypothetical protein